jgi:hypothetical protein
MSLEKDIDLSDPDFVIDCSKITKSVDIYTIMHSYNNPKFYCYAICYRKGLLIDFIKIGESAPAPGQNTAESIGERIKRQLEHVPGWEDPPYYSEHGNDFWSNVSREINEGTLPNISKDNLLIGVWNLDAMQHRIPFLYESNKEVSLYVEGLLCKQYKKLHNGHLPILNIKDPTRNKSFLSPKLDKTLWSFA